MRVKRTVIAGIICCILGVVLFLIFHYIGNLNRPAPALGGELLVALLPFLVYFIFRPILRDIFCDIM